MPPVPVGVAVVMPVRRDDSHHDSGRDLTGIPGRTSSQGLAVVGGVCRATVLLRRVLDSVNDRLAPFERGESSAPLLRPNHRL